MLHIVPYYFAHYPPSPITITTPLKEEEKENRHIEPSEIPANNNAEVFEKTVWHIYRHEMLWKYFSFKCLVVTTHTAPLVLSAVTTIVNRVILWHIKAIANGTLF